MERKKLEKSISELDAKLDHLFDILENYKEEKLNQSPAQDKWSPTQIMNHLILAEKLSIGYCKKKLSFEPQLSKAGWMASLRSAMIRAYLHSPLKIKAPTFISTPALPKEDTLGNIKKNWREVRQELNSFIQEVPDKYIDKEVYKHPFGGRLSLLGMIKVMHAHFENHQKQLLKAIK